MADTLVEMKVEYSHKGQDHTTSIRVPKGSFYGISTVHYLTKWLHRELIQPHQNPRIFRVSLDGVLVFDNMRAQVDYNDI